VSATATVALCRRRAARIRAASLEMISESGFGFAGSCLSAAEIIAAASVSWSLGDGALPAPDVICLSKGHAAPALYGLLLGRNWRAAGGPAQPGAAPQGEPRPQWVEGAMANAVRL